MLMEQFGLRGNINADRREAANRIFRPNTMN
jgi:hypothetical protein